MGTGSINELLFLYILFKFIQIVAKKIPHLGGYVSVQSLFMRLRTYTQFYNCILFNGNLFKGFFFSIDK